MPPLIQPVTLTKLTLAAVTKYVLTIGQTVFKTLCDRVSHPSLISEEEALKKNKFNLESLSMALYGDIPNVLWFDVTKSVFSAINKLIYMAYCNIDGFTTTGHQICKDFLEELILILIVPYVTYLDFGDHMPLLLPVLVKHLGIMQNLKVLKLTGMKSEDIVVEHLASLTSLTSFTMTDNCNDEIIHVLAHNCKKLQTLNVAGSLAVTDKSVMNIMKLQNLQHLNIYCTKITHMEALCSSEPKEVSGFPLKDIYTLKNLQALDCGPVGNEQLHAIAHTFLKLTHISVSTVRCDFRILSVMKHVKEFKVIYGNFIRDNIADVLEAVGHQLEILELMMMQHVDLGVIATHCVNLNTLSVNSCHVNRLLQTPRLVTKSDKDLPFHKLENLIFVVEPNDTELLGFILTRSIALRSLEIGKMRGFDENFISSCLSMNLLKKLEQLKMTSDDGMPLQLVHLLLENCPNLSVIIGVQCWENPQQCELLQLLRSLKRKNYAINIV